LPECEPEQFKRNFIETIYRPGHFRGLTAHDYCRLQGFPESFQLHHHDAVAKKQLGNAVSMPVVEAIGRTVIACLP
jgi:DNA (cytosine-5)-methyltransferase 1